MDFLRKFEITSKKNNSLLCVGLDPEPAKFPKRASVFHFNKKIIDETANLVACFKPNIAFYEALGTDGLVELKKTIEYVKKKFRNIPVILDAKRADIPNTAKMYAKALYEYWQVDAATVYPQPGFDTVEPYLKYKEKTTILILKTSNPGSKTFQDIKIKGDSYYLAVAEEIKKWKAKNFGIFFGATYPKEAKKIREIFPNRFFLSAGLGTQGADVGDIVKSTIDKNNTNVVFNASRSIIFSKNPQDAAEKLRNEINKYRF